jgi:hypothetical protein
MVAIPKLTKRFETSLASALSEAGTSFTLESATDEDGNALSGLYGLTVDVGSADVEDMIVTISGTTATIVFRGIDADNPVTEVSANKNPHRRGAPVVITDYPILAYLRNILNAETGYELPSHLKYASNSSFTDNEELVSKRYADALAIAGAPDGSTTVKGLFEEATQAEIDADTAAGGTSARLAINPSTLATSKYGTRLPSADQKSALASTTTPDANNKYVSQKDFQKAAEVYAASSAGSDTYAVTLSPAPSAYTTGMMVRFKADVANTGAATLNVNGLGAVAIKLQNGDDPSDGDIPANSYPEVIYNGTNFTLLTPPQGPMVAAGVVSDLSTSTDGNNDVTATCGFRPRVIELYYWVGGASDATGVAHRKGVAIFEGTTLKFNNVEWYADNLAFGDLPNESATADLSRETTSTDTIQSGNSNNALITVTVNSVSATGFVIRRLVDVDNGSPGTAAAKISWKAYR